jgi:excisionase family DNA binding protein
MEKIAVKPAEAARMVDVSRTTFNRWMHIEGFPVRRIGGCVRIPVADLLEWVRAQGK